MTGSIRVGMYLRNMGAQATRAFVAECARAGEAAGLDDLWVYDHLAIPPEESQGSGGYYLDPLATLAFAAAVTERVGLGTGVLDLPYRPPLPTAKWVASVQTLAAGRLLLGVGVGWIEAEFKALGVDRARRGRITDETIEFLHRAFAADEMTANGQRFLFLPRPQRPPIFVGGTGEHALRRAARLGDGWMPNIFDPEKLRPQAAELARLAAEAGKPAPEIVISGRLAVDDEGALAERLSALAAAGTTRVALNVAYANAAEFRTLAERAVRARARV
jgi:probable F420-dependent oxidoreductase